MDTFINVALIGFRETLQPLTFMYLCLGVFGGMVFGAIPGLTAVMAVTIALPFTFFMNPVDSITLVTGIYIGGISGGCISASLLNMPGTPSSVATTFEAYPMAQRGKAGQALGLALISSGLGGVVSGLILIFAAPLLAWQALKLGPFEYFSLGMFTYLTVCGLLGGKLWKNLLSMAIGLAIASIGVDPLTSVSRFTFGLSGLDGGIAVLPFMVGLFCIPQIIDDVAKPSDVIVPESAKQVSISNMIPKAAVFKNNIVNYIRSFFIGLFTGILPGLGGTTSNIISYQVAKSSSKHPEKYGTGIPDGIIAAETANNASIGGAFVPFLALGIPGDAVTAILLGALMIQGIQPGPLLFKNNADLVYAVFSANLIGVVVMVVLGILLIKGFIRILSFPKKYLLPLITVCCILGAYSCNNRVFDIWVLLALGIFGFIWKRLGFSLVPILIAYILEPIVETGLREGLSLSGGSFWPIVTRPISLTFIILGLLAVIGGIFLKRLIARNKA